MTTTIKKQPTRRTSKSRYQPHPDRARDRETRRKLIGDDSCSSLVLVRMPAALRDRLHAEATRRKVGLNTLCLVAFEQVMSGGESQVGS